MALKVGCGGPLLLLRDALIIASRLFGGSVAVVGVPGVCGVDGHLLFAFYVGSRWLLAPAQVTTDLELVRTRGIRLFN